MEKRGNQRGDPEAGAEAGGSTLSWRWAAAARGRQADSDREAEPGGRGGRVFRGAVRQKDRAGQRRTMGVGTACTATRQHPEGARERRKEGMRREGRKRMRSKERMLHESSIAVRKTGAKQRK